MARKRADGHIRVSRMGERAGDGYISPEVQREQISAFAGPAGSSSPTTIPTETTSSPRSLPPCGGRT